MSPDDAAPTRYVIPELTRSLRGFASVKALGTKEHDLVFGPLMNARRAAGRVLAPEAKAAAFDSARLRKALREAIAALGTARADGKAALARALEARLEERAAPVFSALDRLEEAATTLKATPGARAAEWAAWCDALQRLFDATDGFWLAIDETAPPPKGMPRLVVMLVATGALLASAASLEAQRAMVRVEGARADSLLAAGFDVVGTDRGAVLVVATPEWRARLVARGYRTSDMSGPRALAAQVATPTVFRSYDDPVRGIRRWVDSLVAANPRVSVDTIGHSFENRPMLMLKIGPKGDSPQRPNVIFIATYHAREWAATEMAERLVKWLAAPPGTDARRDSLVQARDIYVMPVANPDGYQYTFTNDRLWRKTRSPQASGAVGVDMNRNHSVNWGLDSQGSSPEPGSEIFRGGFPASEIEVRNIEAFHAAHPPVVALSYHTYAGLILYAPGAVYGQLPADLPVYRSLAGTHLKSAITDRLPQSSRAAYAPGPAWMLYTTNGEYTDFASARFGALAFTTEITSGTGTAGFYGFEFPDDETLLDRLFQDNLPFALDLLDAARDPSAYRSASTGMGPERVVLESVSPDVRVTVPASVAAGTAISAGGALTYRIDSTNGGKYSRRLISTPAGRPATLSVQAGGSTSTYRVLSFSGAESADPQWTMTGGFGRDSTFPHSGVLAYMGTSGTLTTPSVAVPQDADTVSLAYWTMHFGSGFSPEPSGEVSVSADNGVTWTRVLIQRSSAPLWYTDRAVVGGIRGKSIRFRFSTNGMVWRVDDAAIVAHGPVTSTSTAVVAAVRPSENPVRSGSVRLSWPFGTTAGELTAFDITGRAVWRQRIISGEVATWDLEAKGVANGVYVIVAKTSSQTSRLKLFVARGAR